MAIFLLFDIDGVIRDVSQSYRRALADTVESFTHGNYRPTEADIDTLKNEGKWNNDWEASREMVYRYFEQHGQTRTTLQLDYEAIVDFFQRRYRGEQLQDPAQWDGYICQEPLLVDLNYFQQLTKAGITWGFFSGATRASATFILQQRLGLRSPTLIAMEDVPGKPDPKGLFAAIAQLGIDCDDPPKTVIYVGDTVADMQTVTNARTHQANSPNCVPNSIAHWIGVGVLPPHVQQSERAVAYRNTLQQSGAAIVLDNVMELDASQVNRLVNSFVKSS
jgi:HAD superfamily phosphatase